MCDAAVQVCERMKACCADISQPFLTSEAEKNIVTLSSAAVVIGLGTSFDDAATAASSRVRRTEPTAGRLHREAKPNFSNCSRREKSTAPPA